MSERPFTVAVLALLALAITFYIRSEAPPTAVPATAVSGDDYGPAPDISLPIGTNGKKVDLSSLHGKVVMLDFWATWCGPCKMSMPELEHIYEKHKADGLEVVGISTDDTSTRGEVNTTAKALGITYPIANYADIPDCQSKYEFASIPMLFIIDKKGIVRARVNGYDPNGSNEELVAKLLAEK
jgi:cytochrome c biogenesis protein CcmG/thiol:disulfide interchange protein DsbE